jgi:hypothetical protein
MICLSVEWKQDEIFESPLKKETQNNFKVQVFYRL